MYGVPNKQELQFLVGAELIQICFGSGDIILSFADTTYISLRVSVKHTLPNGEISVTDEPWKRGTSLTMLLGSTIESVDVIDGKILRLDFSKGHRVEVADETEQYESFLIKSAERLIVV